MTKQLVLIMGNLYPHGNLYNNETFQDLVDVLIVDVFEIEWQVVHEEYNGAAPCCLGG